MAYRLAVVLYLTSTSNHNCRKFAPLRDAVVLYLTSTSNHNAYRVIILTSLLCYILLLHRTTTAWKKDYFTSALCYILLLHRTTTVEHDEASEVGCVISYFYIEPQLSNLRNIGKKVVLYLTSTSNHNVAAQQQWVLKLCYILLLHRTTTNFSHFNLITRLCYILLLHRTTTMSGNIQKKLELCYILLLHRTTTQIAAHFGVVCCVISYFYIEPQLAISEYGPTTRCVISYFYIEPQLIVTESRIIGVVLYLTSTSNHNYQSGYTYLT